MRTRTRKLLDDRINTLARNAVDPSPARQVFRNVGSILTLTRDNMINDEDCVQLSECCFDIYLALEPAIQGKNTDDLNESLGATIGDLERLTREIERTLRRDASTPHIKYGKRKAEEHKLKIRDMLGGLNPQSSPLVIETATLVASVVSGGTVGTSVVGGAFKRLIERAFAQCELPSLIEAIFSNDDESNMVSSLRGDDAQTFIDVIDQALDGSHISPQTRKKCVKSLYRICRSHALLPKALQVPFCYDRTSVASYRGGFADVWKGEHCGRDVAAKVLRTYSNSDLQKVVGKFCKEVVTWKTLRHPNVLALIGVAMTEAQFAMVSEWMVNGNIIDFVKANPGANRFRLLEGVAKGLIYVHGRGMIHGDLKGANVLIDQTGNARLADFGLLTIISDPTNLMSSCSYTHGGTARWMSPELINPQAFGLENSRPTKRSDCYALGMVIYETISGHSPFHKYLDLTVFVKVLAGERPARGVGFTESLWKMLELCWAPQPKNRPSIEDVLLGLEAAPDSPESRLQRVDEEMEEEEDDCGSMNDSSAFVLPDPVGPAERPSVAGRKTISGSLVNDSLASGTRPLGFGRADAHRDQFSPLPIPGEDGKKQQGLVAGPAPGSPESGFGQSISTFTFGQVDDTPQTATPSSPLVSGTSKLVEMHSPSASQTMGRLPFDFRKSDKISHGPSGLTFSQQQSRMTTSGPFDFSQGQTLVPPPISSERQNASVQRNLSTFPPLFGSRGGDHPEASFPPPVPPPSTQSPSSFSRGLPPQDPPVEPTNVSIATDPSKTSPKRPLNAFMIFARKRRPEVSDVNRMMRPGEISKVLSKEWNSMDISQKQVYLDQAKRLKDIFNSMYPDYVYRRRPNDVRKGRKNDAGPLLMTDPEDLSGYDPSPIDGDGLDGRHPSHYSFNGQNSELSPASLDEMFPHVNSSALHSSYPYPQSHHPLDSGYPHRPSLQSLPFPHGSSNSHLPPLTSAPIYSPHKQPSPPQSHISGNGYRPSQPSHSGYRKDRTDWFGYPSTSLTKMATHASSSHWASSMLPPIPSHFTSHSGTKERLDTTTALPTVELPLRPHGAQLPLPPLNSVGNENSSGGGGGVPTPPSYSQSGGAGGGWW